MNSVSTLSSFSLKSPFFFFFAVRTEHVQRTHVNVTFPCRQKCLCILLFLPSDRNLVLPQLLYLSQYRCTFERLLVSYQISKHVNINTCVCDSLIWISLSLCFPQSRYRYFPSSPFSSCRWFSLLWGTTSSTGITPWARTSPSCWRSGRRCRTLSCSSPHGTPPLLVSYLLLLLSEFEFIYPGGCSLIWEVWIRI